MPQDLAAAPTSQPASPAAPSALRPIEDIGRDVAQAYKQAFGTPAPFYAALAQLLAPIVERDRREVRAAAMPLQPRSSSAVAREILDAIWNSRHLLDKPGATLAAVAAVIEQDRAERPIPSPSA